MQTSFISEPMNYLTDTLSSHFAYRNWGILGNSCVAFVGSCEVPLEGMVDLEDVLRQAPIYSPEMLHFIWESFSSTLEEAVFWQRLMVVLVYEQLKKRNIQDLRRKGDDLYLGEKKLSVSIATVSPVSSLVHLGLNIRTERVPVPAVGLADFQIVPQDFAENCLLSFQEELLSCTRARCKVRAVR